DAIDTVKTLLIPKATVVTPNAGEAEILTGMRIRNPEDAAKAAESIASLGPEAVVVKGGHIDAGPISVDTLWFRGEITKLQAPRVESRTTHGTGCGFSAAIAAQLAWGKSIPEAVRTAHEFVHRAIRFGLPLGKGYGPVNPMVDLYNDAERYAVVSRIEAAVDVLEAHPEAAVLIPEVQSNLVMALPYAGEVADVAGIEGRIVRTERGPRAAGCPVFGASKHLANTVLAVMKHDATMRAAFNMRFTEDAVQLCHKLGLTVSSYDRTKEPAKVKASEGRTTHWGAEEAVKAAGRVPDVIYHRGDWGKEPMITVLGRSPQQVVGTVIKIAGELKDASTV
ncbi:MAG: PfkB family carbohydrate kinase, partial [Candidatus Bathyarchaeia archaeon]